MKAERYAWENMGDHSRIFRTADRVTVERIPWDIDDETDAQHAAAVERRCAELNAAPPWSLGEGRALLWHGRPMLGLADADETTANHHGADELAARIVDLLNAADRRARERARLSADVERNGAPWLDER
jgi:hypothetical protein